MRRVVILGACALAGVGLVLSGPLGSGLDGVERATQRSAGSTAREPVTGPDGGRATTATTETGTTDDAVLDRLPALPLAEPATAGGAPAPAAGVAAATAGPVARALASTGPPTFVPLTPARILDTRSGTGARAGTVGPGGRIDLQVTGRGGVAATGVTAVVLNVTVTAPTAATYVSVWPSDEARPATSTLNVVAGQTSANVAVVKLSPTGQVSLLNFAGQAHLVADVQGYFQRGSDFTPVVPARVLDTRAGAVPVSAGGSVAVRVAGRAGVPASGASAVVLNVTAVSPSASTYLSVFPTNGSPTVSTLNVLAGRTTAVATVARLSPDGAVSVSNAAGTTHVIVDVGGWFAADGSYVPVTATRVFDSRSTTYGPLVTDDRWDLPLAGYGGTAVSGVTAVVASVTAVTPTAPGYLTVHPFGTGRPVASNANFAAGENRPALVVLRVGAGGWGTVYNSAGRTHVIVDVLGYFRSDAVPTFPARAQEPASVDASGRVAASLSSDLCPAPVSGDGRFVLFSSDAPGVEPYWPQTGATGGGVFVRDTALGLTRAVTLLASPAGACPLGLSRDGRWAAWVSRARFFSGDANGAADVFVTDLSGGRTLQASWSATSGQAAAGATTGGALSADGRWVAMTSTATDLAPGGDPNGAQPTAYLLDLRPPAGRANRVRVAAGEATSVSDAGDVTWTDAAGSHLYRAASGTSVLVGGPGSRSLVSADGSTVAVRTTQALVAADTNGVADVYRRPLTGGTPGAPVLVSRSATGAGAADRGSDLAGLAADGSTVLLRSTATNLTTARPLAASDVYACRTACARVPVTAGGGPLAGAFDRPWLAASGRFATYLSMTAGTPFAGPARQVLVAPAG